MRCWSEWNTRRGSSRRHRGNDLASSTQRSIGSSCIGSCWYLTHLCQLSVRQQTEVMKNFRPARQPAARHEEHILTLLAGKHNNKQIEHSAASQPWNSRAGLASTEDSWSSLSPVGFDRFVELSSTKIFSNAPVAAL